MYIPSLFARNVVDKYEIYIRYLLSKRDCLIDRLRICSRESKSIKGEYAGEYAKGETSPHLAKLSTIVVVVVVAYAAVMVAACTWWKVSVPDSFQSKIKVTFDYLTSLQFPNYFQVKNGGNRDEQALLGNSSGDGSVASASSAAAAAAPVAAESSSSDELYSAVAPTSLTSNWSWNCARLVKELGKGFYGDVYLAEEVSGRLVAVKKRNRDVHRALKPASYRRRMSVALILLAVEIINCY